MLDEDILRDHGVQLTQSRTQSNACLRVRLALALGKRNELRMISYALA